MKEKPIFRSQKYRQFNSIWQEHPFVRAYEGYDSSICIWWTHKIKNQGFWGCFYREGLQHNTIGYKFTIDTGNIKTVWCKNVLYELYESKIVLEKIGQFLEKGWIS